MAAIAWTVCTGCMREVDVLNHKMCPAWGTPYYMTGIPYTEELEKQYHSVHMEMMEKASRYYQENPEMGMD